VYTSNVVLKATVMPEWRNIFEAEDSDLEPLQGGPEKAGVGGSIPSLATTI
jgi:hypothetical protein